MNYCIINNVLEYARTVVKEAKSTALIYIPMFQLPSFKGRPAIASWKAIIVAWALLAFVLLMATFCKAIFMLRSILIFKSCLVFATYKAPQTWILGPILLRSASSNYLAIKKCFAFEKDGLGKGERVKWSSHNHKW